jgi:hypothetical protein
MIPAPPVTGMGAFRLVPRLVVDGGKLYRAP